MSLAAVCTLSRALASKSERPNTRIWCKTKAAAQQRAPSAEPSAQTITLKSRVWQTQPGFHSAWPRVGNLSFWPQMSYRGSAPTSSNTADSNKWLVIGIWMIGGAWCSDWWSVSAIRCRLQSNIWHGVGSYLWKLFVKNSLKMPCRKFGVKNWRRRWRKITDRWTDRQIDRWTVCSLSTEQKLCL